MIKILIALLIISFSSCQNKSSDDEEKNRILAGVVLTRLGLSSTGSTAVSTTNTTCAISAPSFSTLASAGVNTSCARSGCHAGASPQSGYDASNFTSTRARVNSGNPDTSLLYQKINGGSMTQYSNSQINTAIFCWIKGGAAQ